MDFKPRKQPLRIFLVFRYADHAVRTCPHKLWCYLLFMRLKMAIRFLNWSLRLIILLRCVGGDFQVTSEFDSFENQLQRAVEPTSPGICYASITRWHRSSLASSSHGMFFFMSHAWITRWQRSLFAFSSRGMFFFMSPNKGLSLRTRKRK